jgi:hypothetical protein
MILKLIHDYHTGECKLVDLESNTIVDLVQSVEFYVDTKTDPIMTITMIVTDIDISILDKDDNEVNYRQFGNVTHISLHDKKGDHISGIQSFRFKAGVGIGASIELEKIPCISELQS